MPWCSRNGFGRVVWRAKPRFGTRHSSQQSQLRERLHNGTATPSGGLAGLPTICRWSSPRVSTLPLYALSMRTASYHLSSQQVLGTAWPYHQFGARDRQGMNLCLLWVTIAGKMASVLPDLVTGQTLFRREVHLRYGGQRQGGISTPDSLNAVLFFTDPEKGHRHGYYDGLAADGRFHYVGEGQRGDQKFERGNKAILSHHTNGETLEGFLTTGTSATYLGEFELEGHYFTDAHETDDRNTLRQVVVFKLRPLGDLPVALPPLPITPTLQPTIKVVPVEENNTERAFVTPDREPYELERRESALVQSYREYLEGEGYQVGRLLIVPPGESRPLYSDLWNETREDLIEAKSTVTRDQMRQAVGQLLDYGRFVPGASRTILVPSRPRQDLLDYVKSAGVGVAFPDRGGWAYVAP